MTPEENDLKLKILKDTCSRLSEHFDNVQILASINPTETGPSAGETSSFRWGIGNWWARLGQIRDFLDEQLANEIRRDD